MLQLGPSMLLSRRTLLDIQLGIGLTPDAPDFRLSVALPVQMAKSTVFSLRPPAVNEWP